MASGGGKSGGGKAAELVATDYALFSGVLENPIFPSFSNPKTILYDADTVEKTDRYLKHEFSTDFHGLFAKVFGISGSPLPAEDEGRLLDEHNYSRKKLVSGITVDECDDKRPRCVFSGIDELREAQLKTQPVIFSLKEDDKTSEAHTPFGTVLKKYTHYNKKGFSDYCIGTLRNIKDAASASASASASATGPAASASATSLEKICLRDFILHLQKDDDELRFVFGFREMQNYSNLMTRFRSPIPELHLYQMVAFPIDESNTHIKQAGKYEVYRCVYNIGGSQADGKRIAFRSGNECNAFSTSSCVKTVKSALVMLGLADTKEDGIFPNRFFDDFERFGYTSTEAALLGINAAASGKKNGDLMFVLDCLEKAIDGENIEIVTPDNRLWNECTWRAVLCQRLGYLPHDVEILLGFYKCVNRVKINQKRWSLKPVPVRVVNASSAKRKAAGAPLAEAAPAEAAPAVIISNEETVEAVAAVAAAAGPVAAGPVAAGPVAGSESPSKKLKSAPPTLQNDSLFTVAKSQCNRETINSSNILTSNAIRHIESRLNDKIVKDETFKKLESNPGKSSGRGMSNSFRRVVDPNPSSYEYQYHILVNRGFSKSELPYIENMSIEQQADQYFFILQNYPGYRFRLICVYLKQPYRPEILVGYRFRPVGPYGVSAAAYSGGGSATGFGSSTFRNARGGTRKASRRKLRRTRRRN